MDMFKLKQGVELLFKNQKCSSPLEHGGACHLLEKKGHRVFKVHRIHPLGTTTIHRKADRDRQLISEAALNKMYQWELFKPLTFQFPKRLLQTRLGDRHRNIHNDLHTNRNTNNKSCYKNNLLNCKIAS